MKAGIALDDYKLPVFRKRLTEAGFEYTDAGPLAGSLTMLHVEVEEIDLPRLQATLESCQAECRAQRKAGE